MLSIQHLQAGYNGNVVVDVPSFSLPTGEHCLILGQSGSGKTTLLYAIAGLLTPMAGEILLDTTRFSELSEAKRDAYRGKHIGIIYQSLHMVPALTVLDNMLLVPYAAGLPCDTAYAESLLARLGLSAYRDTKPEALSQGQLQRVAIARAAMARPRLILGDEPTSALDDAACETVMGLLLDTARATGASLIIATHDARIKHHFSHQLTLGGAA